jgi:thiol-disulfide isomerase/thioredoxin
MKKFFVCAAFAATLCFGQGSGQKSGQDSGPNSGPGKDLSEAEKKELGTALGEAGNSPLEFARALETHLEKYPQSSQRDELERALIKSAMEANDKVRILNWGEKSLAKNIDQPQLLERVTRILLETEDKERSERALKYARQFEQSLRALVKEAPTNPRQRAQFNEELDRAVGRSLSLQARATGNLGMTGEAVALALKSFETYATHEAAREAGKWLGKAGKGVESARRYADAFVAPDNTAELRVKDRQLMAENYRAEKGSEVGLGDLVLEAHDRAYAVATKRLARLREVDPNIGVTNPVEYTLTGLNGDRLKLTSLKGKVVIFDFWATWCGPCRIQHPLYEEVKKRFAGKDDVVFLAINTDEDQNLVRPFLEENKWNGKTVYFEDGLSNLLKVSSIPTTIVFDKQGQIFSRMNGFVPEKFVDQLTARIDEARGEARSQ